MEDGDRRMVICMMITCYAHRDKGFQWISLIINSLSGALHLPYGWDPRTKVMACATRVTCAKEFVIE